MLTLLSSLAFAGPAEADMVCYGPVPVASLPAPGSGGVPVDVRPIVLFSSDCGAGVWTFVLTRGDDGAEVARAELEVTTEGELVLAEPLEPHTDYVLALSEATYGGEHVVAFTTGDGDPSEPPGPPAIVDLAAAWDLDDTVAVEAAVEPGGGVDVLIELVDEEAGVVARKVSRLGREVRAAWVGGAPEEAPATWCAHARQRDLRGTWTESEVACADVEVTEEDATAWGCSTGGLAPAMLSTMLALGATRRRAR
ncbi:MAG: hypothetical protein ACOZNI_15945 [Myxococcota bacterium]